MRSVAGTLISAALCVTGCFRTQANLDGGTSRDAESDSAIDAHSGDAGVRDGSVDRNCDPIGDRTPCDDLCEDQECPGREHCARDVDVCARSAESCVFVLDEPGDGLPSSVFYCNDGDLCARSPEPAREVLGVCVDYGYCRQAPSRGAEGRCVYSDGTEFVAGPADDGCQAPVSEVTPFCGVDCPVVCPQPTPTLSDQARDVQCVGVNETRGYGFCALSDRQCLPGVHSDAVRLIGRHTLEPMGCAVFHRTFNDLGFGFITAQATCIAYAERFGQLDCYAEDGAVLHVSPR